MNTKPETSAVEMVMIHGFRRTILLAVEFKKFLSYAMTLVVSFLLKVPYLLYKETGPVPSLFSGNMTATHAQLSYSLAKTGLEQELHTPSLH